MIDLRNLKTDCRSVSKKINFSNKKPYFLQFYGIYFWKPVQRSLKSSICSVSSSRMRPPPAPMVAPSSSPLSALGTGRTSSSLRLDKDTRCCLVLYKLTMLKLSVRKLNFKKLCILSWRYLCLWEQVYIYTYLYSMCTGWLLVCFYL